MPIERGPPSNFNLKGSEKRTLALCTERTTRMIMMMVTKAEKIDRVASGRRRRCA